MLLHAAWWFEVVDVHPDSVIDIGYGIYPDTRGFRIVSSLKIPV
jgi:hypothetical protein